MTRLIVIIAGGDKLNSSILCTFSYSVKKLATIYQLGKLVFSDNEMTAFWLGDKLEEIPYQDVYTVETTRSIFSWYKISWGGDKTIYVQRVFPVGKGYAGYNNTQVANYNKNRINPFNASIKAYCNTKSNVKFIDTTSGFVDANGFLINCETDGLHILDSYSTKFYNNIQTAVINVQ